MNPLFGAWVIVSAAMAPISAVSEADANARVHQRAYFDETRAEFAGQECKPPLYFDREVGGAVTRVAIFCLNDVNMPEFTVGLEKGAIFAALDGATYKLVHVPAIKPHIAPQHRAHHVAPRKHVVPRRPHSPLTPPSGNTLTPPRGMR